MKKPVLVIMAAGMGSRYGGLKQIDPIDKEGHIIMDFSIFDAYRAGFRKVVFIIKEENKENFQRAIGDRVSKTMEVSYVFQKNDSLPEGYELPKERSKPWGTGHAILSCIDTVKEPFVVINADDYYGKHAFEVIYDFLTQNEDDEKYRYAMVGYILKNTLTDNGHVARGVCEIGENEFLKEITERTHIEKREEKAVYTEDEGKSWMYISTESIVSMNMWGFTESILGELQERFADFLEENLQKNPLKCEYFLPSVVDALIKEGKASVKVLKSEDKWYGVTYKEDKPFVMEAIEKLKEDGIYPREF